MPGKAILVAELNISNGIYVGVDLSRVRSAVVKTIDGKDWTLVTVDGEQEAALLNVAPAVVWRGMAGRWEGLRYSDRIPNEDMMKLHEEE